MSIAPGQPPAPLLELTDVYAGYGKFRVLFGVSLSVPPSTAVALVGPNGSGKTTVARVCAGLVRPTAGAITFAGVRLRRPSPHELVAAGLVHLPEGRGVFAGLSVEENLLLPLRQSVGRHGAADALEDAYAQYPLLKERRRQPAGLLSGGEQRLLSVARVLARPPVLLVADELSLGLAPGMVDEVYAALARLRDAGTAILLVEQHADRAALIAQSSVQLRRGRVVD